MTDRPDDLNGEAQEAVRVLIAATDQVLHDWRDRKLTTREPFPEDMRVGRDLANSLNQLTRAAAARYLYDVDRSGPSTSR